MALDSAGVGSAVLGFEISNWAAVGFDSVRFGGIAFWGCWV